MHFTGQPGMTLTLRNTLVVREYTYWSIIRDVRNTIVARQPAYKEQLGQETIFYTIRYVAGKHIIYKDKTCRKFVLTPHFDTSGLLDSSKVLPETPKTNISYKCGLHFFLWFLRKQSRACVMFHKFLIWIDAYL